MSKHITTYEVVGDYLKTTIVTQGPSSTTGHSTRFNYIKNGIVNITGSIENLQRIDIIGPTANTTTVINTTGSDNNGFPIKDTNEYIPDLKGLVQNIFKSTGIQSASGGRSSRKTRRRRNL